MYEELTAKIRPCERKKMQFILIGKLDNISIKLLKISCIISEKKLKNLHRTLGFYFLKKPKKPKFGLFRFLGFF